MLWIDYFREAVTTPDEQQAHIYVLWIDYFREGAMNLEGGGA